MPTMLLISEAITVDMDMEARSVSHKSENAESTDVYMPCSAPPITGHAIILCSQDFYKG